LLRFRESLSKFTTVSDNIYLNDDCRPQRIHYPLCCRHTKVRFRKTERQRKSEKDKERHRNAKKGTENQRKTKKIRERQRKTEKHRETQRKTEKNYFQLTDK
jgi:hypothetical protein